MQQIKSTLHWDSYQWIGVHVRRSDHLAWYNAVCQLPSDYSSYAHNLAVVEYVKTMKEMYKAFSCSRVPLKFFLATDDRSVEAEVAERFSEGESVQCCPVV